MDQHNLSVPIPQRKKAEFDLPASCQNPFKHKCKVDNNSTHNMKHFGSLLELYNLKKLNAIEMNEFSTGLIFDSQADYSSMVSELESLNKMTLDKVKDLSLNIHLLKQKLDQFENQTTLCLHSQGSVGSVAK